MSAACWVQSWLNRGLTGWFDLRPPPQVMVGAARARRWRGIPLGPGYASTGTCCLELTPCPAVVAPAVGAGGGRKQAVRTQGAAARSAACPATSGFFVAELLFGAPFPLQVHMLFIPGPHDSWKKEYVMKAAGAFHFEVAQVRR